MGLIMLILIGLAPATYALHLPLAPDKLQGDHRGLAGRPADLRPSAIGRL